METGGALGAASALVSFACMGPSLGSAGPATRPGKDGPGRAVQGPPRPWGQLSFSQGDIALFPPHIRVVQPQWGTSKDSPQCGVTPA